MRGKVRFAFFWLVALLALLMFVGVSSASAATVSSDKPDYAPGDTVMLTGTEWGSDTVADIVVQDALGFPWVDHEPALVVGGSFVYAFQLPPQWITTYYVTATGSPSGVVATTSFTDTINTKIDFLQAQNWPTLGASYPYGQIEWTNSELSKNNSVYYECMSTPYRIAVKDLDAVNVVDNDDGTYSSHHVLKWEMEFGKTVQSQ